MGSYGIRVGPESNSWSPCKKRNGDRDTIDKDDVKMETEITVVLPPAKEHQEPGEAGKGKEESRAFGGSTAGQYIDFRLLDPRTERE